MRGLRDLIRFRGIVLAVALGGMAFSPAQAQRWVDSRYPYITSGANDFPMLAGRMQWTQPVDDYLSPLPYFGNLSLDAGISFNSSYFVTAMLRMPRLADGWRLAANASVVREARLGYFGIGNNSTFDNDLVNDNQPFFYRVRRKRQLVNGEITRRISGPLKNDGANRATTCHWITNAASLNG